MKASTQSWLEFTKRDLLAAEKLLAEVYLQNVVLFHCQQAVEKVFKAILEEHDLRIPRVHSVVTLYERFPEAVKTLLHFDRDELRFIDEIYTDSRYPADLGLLPGGFPGQEEGKRFFDLAQKVVDACLELLAPDAEDDKVIIPEQDSDSLE